MKCARRRRRSSNKRNSTRVSMDKSTPKHRSNAQRSCGSKQRGTKRHHSKTTGKSEPKKRRHHSGTAKYGSKKRNQKKQQRSKSRPNCQKRRHKKRRSGAKGGCKKSRSKSRFRSPSKSCRRKSKSPAKKKDVCCEDPKTCEEPLIGSCGSMLIKDDPKPDDAKAVAEEDEERERRSLETSAGNRQVLPREWAGRLRPVDPNTRIDIVEEILSRNSLISRIQEQQAKYYPDGA